ncbi:hypothetical protein BU25DRAFT_108276 [Macroventuria anomochaeta]|uniref:Uncharacterized protein n=1 Tax=Macroventuria anomochaeta TaxID=301207 RepID=A0ACB6RUJ6_9PLEO|nr:uncharacterized protein BU25DRAFT_108276 [Macroventuria anomochaeta]KAF2625650.1 hypothetical protein BU25DRAFT_108276 [Macroventuria anomochaeta]
MSNMSSSINTGLLRTLTPGEIPSELHTLRLKLSDDTITQQLLNAIECGSLSTPVFAAWFGVCRSPVVVRESLTQKLSVHIRVLGIKQLKSGLESAQWGKLWDGLGGTAGLLDILSDLSVLEVKAACRAIGRCARDGNVASKRTRVTELFKSLHPDIFPETAAKTNDLRPLTKFYQALIPSCTAELVDWITHRDQESRWQYVKETKLLEHHSDNLGRAAMLSVFEDQLPDDKSKDRLRRLSTRFPSTTSSEPGFSTSMVFALPLLRSIVDTDVRHVEDDWVLNNLIRPLLRRAVRKRVSWSRMQEITSLALKFLEQHRNAAKLLTNAKGDVLHMVASCWSRRSTLFEAQLKELLNIVFSNKTCFEDIENLIAGIPRSRRYALLCLSCQEVMGVNLDSEQGLSKARGTLTPNLLDKIEAPQAMGLFKRLRSARGDIGLVELGQYSSVLVTTRTPDGYEGDPDIYHLVLLNRNGLYEEAESYAAKILEARKKTIRTTSNRDTRAELAVSVWACANASGSLTLLAETVQWARGFVRDQLTASKLFSTYFDETYRLLSGFLIHGYDVLKPHDLRRRVEHANVIMLDLLDIACAALREPSFRSNDWLQTIDVFMRVVKERVVLSANMKKEIGAEDEDLYYALWEDTITMLVRAERLANHEDYEKLGANTIVTFNLVFPGIKPRTLERSTWKFIDNLAKVRDDLWKELRPAKYPDVLSLPDPFPRGLAVQQLLAGWTPNVADLYELAPYIASRVRTALFVDPEAALKPVSPDKITQQAIGVFVDSYQFALRAYIPDVCDSKEKEKRLRQVWNHATGPLSERRMGPEEAVRLWKQFIPSDLRLILSEFLPKKESVQWPIVPTSDDPSDTQEWNPLEGRPADVKIKARKLGKATYIDISTLGAHAKHTRPDLKSHYQLPNSQVPAETSSVGSIWGYRSRTSAETEAEGLAALLYLDAKYGSAGRLLTTPFPSSDDVLYPCVYLDEDFLSSDRLRVPDVASFISHHCGDIPLPLVHKIAGTLVGRFSSKPNPHILENAAFTLLRTLSENDRPVLAFELAIQVIMEQPSASSWHRMLFNNGFLQRIPASDARRCISTYAEAIGNKLDAQKLDAQAIIEAEHGKKTNGDDATTTSPKDAPQPNQPFIKVVTLKSLAQLLHGSTYIGDDAALEILSNLSRRITHIDVRLNILKTLLSKLVVDRPELWNRVLSAVDPFIPLAGSLNEREPMTDDDWTQAKKTMTMPKIQLMTKPGWQEESPMLDAILNQYVRRDGSGDLLDRYSKRIIFPLIQVLKQQTARWATFFLKKYASDNDTVLEVDLPPIPRGATILEHILTNPYVKARRVPQALLDEYVAYMLFKISPPKPIRTLNNTLVDDPAVKSRPEVQTWLDLYGNGVETAWLYRLPFNSIEYFEDQEQGDGSIYVTRRAFQKRWFNMFTALLWADNSVYGQLQAFASTLTNSNNQTRSWWNEYGKTTIEAMLSYVNSIRTRDWEANPHRKPAVLPQTFHWQLSLLTYPFNYLAYGDQETREQACKAFANELAAILDNISNSVYHTRLTQIKDHICDRSSARNTEFKSNLMLTALYLGDISKTRLSWLTTAELLRVDLAADMMLAVESLMLSDQRLHLDYETFKSRLKSLLGTWVTSENEEVRRKGYRVRAVFNFDVE